jgi:hypothetical protein
VRVEVEVIIAVAVAVAVTVAVRVLVAVCVVVLRYSRPRKALCSLLNSCGHAIASAAGRSLAIARLLSTNDPNSIFKITTYTNIVWNRRMSTDI